MRTGVKVTVVLAAVIALPLLFFLGQQTSYDRFQKLVPGSRIGQVIEELGEPFAFQEAGEHTEYMFWLTGSPDAPKLFGEPYPVFGVVRVRAGLVIEKGDSTLWSKGNPNSYLGENLEEIWRSVPQSPKTPPEPPFSSGTRLNIAPAWKSALPRGNHFEGPIDLDTTVELFEPRLDWQQN